jgi:hypothetical protein
MLSASTSCAEASTQLALYLAVKASVPAKETSLGRVNS